MDATSSTCHAPNSAWWTGLLESIHHGWEIVQSGESVQSSRGGDWKDDIESNHPDNSDDCIEQDNEDEAGVTDDQVSDYLDEWE